MLWRVCMAMVVLAGCGLTGARADELALRERTAKGAFTGFAKGRFQFQTWDGETLSEKPMDVRRLTLDKPLRVVLQTRSRKDREDVLLKGYDSGQFRIVRDGRDAAERESQVRSVALHESEQSYTGYMERAQEATAGAAAGGEGAAPERPEELVAMGVLTVIHFHQPGALPSARQGDYCRRLAADSRGRLVYRRITVPDLAGPLAARYGLTTLPQFWFYSRSGKLVTRLTERFTPEDFAAAVEAARTGAGRKDE